MKVAAIGLEESFYNQIPESVRKTEGSSGSFENIFQSAMNMINETNQLSNTAEEQEILYAMGKSDSLHDLMVAQQKANISLQYTVAVKNTVLEAYKSIMNLQF